MENNNKKTYNENAKHITISWRANNPDKYKNLSQKHALDYYNRHREEERDIHKQKLTCMNLFFLFGFTYR